MLMTIFSIFGTAIALVMPSSFEMACLISVLYFSFKRAAMIALLSPRFPGLAWWPVYRCVGWTVGTGLRVACSLLFLLVDNGVAGGLGEADLLVAFHASANAGLVALAINQHDIRDVDGSFLLGNATLDVLLRVRLDVFLDHHD